MVTSDNLSLIIQFLKLNLEGVKTLVSWAKEEGWNPGPHDADVFFDLVVTTMLQTTE